MFSGTDHSILQDISHIQSQTIKHMQPPFIFSIVCPYHILQLLSTIWTQWKLCCISKSTTKHRQILDWKSTLPWFFSDRSRKSMIVDSSVECRSPPNCVQYWVCRVVDKIWKRSPISFECMCLQVFVLRSSPEDTPIKSRCPIKKSIRTAPTNLTCVWWCLTLDLMTLLACRCTHNRCKPLRFSNHQAAKPSNRRRFGRRTNLRMPKSRREPVDDGEPRHVHSRFVWQCILLESVEWRRRVGVRPSAF